jgi:hypothetical protein
MRLSWYAGTGVAVFSIWHGDTCTGTFRLPIPELSRMIEVLTEGPPDAADDLRAADAGAPTVAAGPGGMPAAVAALPGDDYGPSQHDRDLPPGRYQDPPEGYGGYGDAPAGHSGDPARAGYSGEPTQAGFGTAEERGYRDWVPGGYQDAPGGYEEFAPGSDYRDAPYQEAPGSYQEAPGSGYDGLPPRGGYRDAPGSGYEEFAPENGYQEAPYQEASGGGYRDAGDEGYRDFPPGDAYRLPDNGYRDAPAGGGYSGPGRSTGSDETSYPVPAGPLGVGRWRTREPEEDYLPGQPADFSSGRDEEAFPADPLDVDYGGEAEQGYLPGPPTDTFTFPAAAASGGHPGEGYSPGPTDGGFHGGQHGGGQHGGGQHGGGQHGGGQHGGGQHGGGQHGGGYRGDGSDEDEGYEPDPADLDHDAGPPESFGYRRGPGDSREREYGHSRGRS